MATRSIRLALLSLAIASSVVRVSAAVKPAGRVVACLTLGAPDVPNEYFQVKDTEQHADVLAYTSRLSFVLTRPGSRKTIFVYKTYDSLVRLYAVRYSSRIATVWESGSSTWTRVFGVSAKGVHLLLERGTHLPPEFTLDGILINSGWVPVGDRCCTADKTEIWARTQGGYSLIATVPFGERYEALAKLEHEAKKK